MTTEEAYRALELQPPVTAQEVKLAYRKRCLEEHPDRHGASEHDYRARRFMEVHAAYTLLRESGFPELQSEPLPEPDFSSKIGGRRFTAKETEDVKLSEKLGLEVPWKTDTIVAWVVGLPAAVATLVYFLKLLIEGIRGG